jgi:hypothetical protein
MFFAGAPRLMLSWRLVYGRGKARVAAAASPAAGNYETLVGLREFEHFLPGFVIVHNRSDGNLQKDVATVASGFVRTFAVASAFRAVFGIEAEVHQRVVALAGFHGHVAAFAAITARRTAAGDELLPTKGHAAIAAVSRLDPNFRLIDKHAVNRERKQKPRPEGEAV